MLLKSPINYFVMKCLTFTLLVFQGHTLSATHLIEHLFNGDTIIQLSFNNSTSKVFSLTFSLYQSLVSSVYNSSALTLTSCVLNIFHNSNLVYTFCNHGQLVLDNLSVTPSILINSLIQCELYNSLIQSNIEVRASLFQDIQLREDSGNLISCGYKELETISECQFIKTSQILQGICVVKAYQYLVY